MLTWVKRHPLATPEMLGYIPDMLHEEDPRSAREQLDSNYQHGGGWQPFEGFEMLPNGNLQYPGDPCTLLLAEAMLHGKEMIRFYNHSWVAIVQPDGTFEVSRMD
jgi:hypothetical protein